MLEETHAGNLARNRERGMVALVGAGPGDPGLLTIRGAELLRSADVLVYDQLANPRLLDLAPAAAIRIFAGKRAGQCVYPQEKINEILIEHARAGRIVVRLKGGDPFVFGRGAEEAEELRAASIRFEVVPGITAGVGAPAYAGMAVTHRDAASAVAFVTGHGQNAADRLDWSALARFPGTLVIYMGVRKLREHCLALVEHGKDCKTPAAVVEAGTLPRQRTVVADLGSLANRAEEERIMPPALLVVGEIVSRRESLRWFEDLPLFGQRVMITRPRQDSERSASVLERLGAEVIVAPTVEILPLADPRPLDDVIDRIQTFDWLVFTSANGVHHFFTRLFEHKLDLRVLGTVRLAAIGPATAEALASYHLRADLVPAIYRSEEFADELAGMVRGKKVLLARADRGRTVLKDELERVAEVEQVPVYRNVDVAELSEECLARLEAGSVDWITLTSSAITRRLFELIPASIRERIGRTISLVSVSPVTTATARELGWEVAAEASVFSWEGIVSALVEQVGKRKTSR